MSGGKTGSSAGGGKGSREELLKKTASLGKDIPSTNKIKELLLANYKLVLQVVAVLVAIFFSHMIWQRGSSGVQNLMNASDDVLKSVLLGEKPYLFYCHRGGKSEAPPPVFHQLHSDKSPAVGFGILNCSQVMPSGKTIRARFGLKGSIVMFATAPWIKPKQIPLEKAKTFPLFRTYFNDITAARATEVLSDKDLRTHCGFARNFTTDKHSVGETCVVLLKGNKQRLTDNKNLKHLEEWLVKAFPRVKMVSLDAEKKRLSFEDTKLLPASEFAIKAHALRNGTHYMTMENPMTWDYLHTFVSHAVGTPLFDYEDNEGPVGLVKTGATASSFKDRSKFQQQQHSRGQDDGGAGTGGSKQSRRAAGKKGDAGSDESQGQGQEQGQEQGQGQAPTQPAETPEERAAREREKEARRREQMERQAKERLFEQHAEGGEGQGEGEEEEEEEDVVEL